MVSAEFQGLGRSPRAYAKGILPSCSAGVHQVTPRKGIGNGSKVAEHFLRDVSNGIGRVFWFALTFEASIDEEL